MINLILCGGAGTRLWPLSRNSLPKQFYPLFDGRTLFEETVLRNKSLVDRFWIASNELQMTLARTQLEKCGIHEVGCLVESVGRNTAAAIALVVLNLNPDEIVLVTPSDHLIKDQKEYTRAVNRAIELAKEGFLVTFGIQPTYPETGFGYIEANGEIVTSFKEKPDELTAKAYIDSGNYYWNSGMFVFKAATFLSELKSHSPQLLEECRVALGSSSNSNEVRIELAAMKSITSISIDYALMEKSKMVRVVPCDPSWSDLGSFDAVYDEALKSNDGNSTISNVKPIFVNSKNNLVVGDKRTIALIDVEDLEIIDTADALLVVRRGSSQKVKDVVSELKKSESPLLD